VFAACFNSGASVGPERAAAALAELLPTSGGTGENDPRSRGGVNDGDEETSGQNPRSTGFAETDQFLDSLLPSLYDVFSDMNGEPYKRQEIEQAVALGGDVRVRELPKPPPDNLRSSRGFATARHAPRQPRDPSARSARALFEVDGPTPLHVRAVAYDFYDGVTWYEARTCAPVGFSAREPGDTWMTVTEPPRPFYHGKVEHRFKIARLDGSLVPTPPYLERFRLGRVDREDFFAWSQERILRLAHRKIPGGVTVETVAHTVDPRLLPELTLNPQDLLCTRGPLQTLGREDVATLARRWVEGSPFGWGQVETVVERLREEYVLDPATRAPVGCADTTHHLLLESKRGPDYEFASAASLLLRQLGYPTWLVSGYYAAPDHYDPQSGHTPVTADDVHFWTEVMLPGRVWVVIEPTPGYEVMAPALPFSERLAAFFARVGDWCAEHTLGIGFSTALLVGFAVLIAAARESIGPSLAYCLLGVLGTGLLAAGIPFGALQHAMSHSDPVAPRFMTAIALPAYNAPLQGMMKLGLMFEHGNSVGAAFSLFELGIGVNLGLVVWLAGVFGTRRVLLWLALLTLVVIGFAYAAEPTLYFAKEEADHTHALDDLSAPFPSRTNVTIDVVAGKLGQKLGALESASLAVLALLMLVGGADRLVRRRWDVDARLVRRPPSSDKPKAFWDRPIPGPVLAIVALLGLVVISVIGAYIYYPDAEQVFRDMSEVRVEAITAVRFGHKEEAIRRLEQWDLLTRKLQVGDYVRGWQLDKAEAEKADDLREALEKVRDDLLAGRLQEAKEKARSSGPVDLAYFECQEAFTGRPPPPGIRRVADDRQEVPR
jgi:transglutaminase-like putative cysteine protease